MEARITTAGEEDIKKALDGVRDAVRNKVLKDAIKGVGKNGSRKQKTLLKNKRTRQLHRSLGMKFQSYRRGTSFIVVLGPRRGFKIIGPGGRTVNPTQYAHLLERGRKSVRAKKTSLFGRRGVMTFVITKGRGKGFRRSRQVRAFAGRPFMRPTLDYLKMVAPWIMRDIITRGVESQAAKWAAKGQSHLKGVKP
jgi:hypothetical protein